MNIIFKAHIHEPTGWGISARNIVSYLISKGHNISIETINFQAQKSESWVDPLIGKFQSADLIINHVLPNYLKRRPHMKNVAYVLTETEDIGWTDWPDYLNTQDEVWVANEDSRDCLLRSHVTIPVHNVGFPVPTDRYDATYKECILPHTDGLFTFYTVAENVPRKNIFDLVAAFHIEFDPQEPVGLLIKTNEDMTQAIEEVRTKLALYPRLQDYKDEAVIPSHVSDDVICGIHQMCDCFVSTSFGEAVCLPMVDAIGFNNYVIGPNYGGPKELLPQDCQFETSSRFCIGSPYKHAYQNGMDSWRVPDIGSLRLLMRKAYENKLSKPKLPTNHFRERLT